MTAHWRLSYPDNLKRGYYITVGLTVLVLLAAYGYSTGKGLLQSRNAAGPEPRIITFSYAQLGAPPSLTGEMVTPTAGAGSKVPTVGIPRPVPDPEAVAVTTSTQADLVGTSPLTDIRAGTEIKVEVQTDIPAYGSYVPHNVKPQLIKAVKPEYPESARLLGIEGTAYLQILLDTDGSAMRVVVAKGSGNAALDTAAVAAGYELKFTPAQQSEKKVRVWVGVPIEFNIAGNK